MGLKCIVVGAGIGGLGSAIALRQAGHEVLLLEKTIGKREVGMGVTMPPNCTRILRSFGMDLRKLHPTVSVGMDIVKADVSPMEWKSERPGDNTEVTYGAPSFFTLRSDWHSTYKEMATSEGAGTPVEIHEGVAVTAYDPSAGTVTLASGEVLSADLIVAADGVRSKAHSWVIHEERPAKLTGVSNVRFVVSTEQILKDPGMSEMLARGEGRAGLYYASGNKLALFRSPLRNNTLQNCGVYAKTDDPDDSEEWITTGNRELAFERLKHLKAISNVPKYAEENEMYLWKVADRDPLPSFCRGRLALVGDACHPMLPFLGQGATQATEDGGILGIVMHNVHDATEVPARLQLWEKLRINRASAAQMLSRSEGVGAWVMSPENIAKAKPFVAKGEVPPTRVEAYDYFYRGDQLQEAREAVESHFGRSVNNMV